MRWSNALMGQSSASDRGASSPRRPELGWGERFETGMSPDVSQPRCGWALIGAAVLGVIGGLTPWAHIHAIEVHRTDIGVQVGWLPFACALVVVTMGALIVVRRGQTWVSVSALLLSLLSLLLMVFESG